ncbi:unnamed protein product [Vitrella brassicaformis CCMP3155]|uniref:Uncharacterized protein n=1 Tax=Vitrella brassicaformis (strain CCMP3155) TaxID=1169540 RepID=A0A0G4E9Z7_VITBC|nr:unnamed protein product [Vitrella brassicaformis CCMP3155]|eukprot:CEL92021.1 unnamed protein product [Vitrella brassicaformis CCMP3155]
MADGSGRRRLWVSLSIGTSSSRLIRPVFQWGERGGREGGESCGEGGGSCFWDTHLSPPRCTTADGASAAALAAAVSGSTLRACLPSSQRLLPPSSLAPPPYLRNNPNSSQGRPSQAPNLDSPGNYRLTKFPSRRW